jgi:signal peptide peptidase SppA
MHKLISSICGAWAIAPAILAQMSSRLESTIDSEGMPAMEANLLQLIRQAEGGQNYEVIDGVAVIPVTGVISKEMDFFSYLFGGVSTKQLKNDIAQSMNDDEVRSVLLHIDSPGGQVDGTAELASTIYDYRGDKKIVALADGAMCSAAYWVGAATEEQYIATSTTCVGDIGVVATHRERSKLEERVGIKTTEVYAGKYKRIASSFKPLSEEGKDYLQGHVDYIYSLFVSEVARFKGVDEETVLKDMADGRAFIGRQAVDAGLVSGIRNLDDLIAQLNSETDSSSAQLNRAHSAQSSQLNGDLVMDITRDTITAEHPVIADALRAEGAEAERLRIQGIENANMPGHEALIETLKFDGKTLPGEAAQQVLVAERDKLNTAGQDLEGGSPDPLQCTASETGDSETTEASANDIATKAKELVNAAKAKGMTLSYSKAVKQAETELT